MGNDLEQAKLTFTNLEELEILAKDVLSEHAFGYYSSGSESEATVQFNRDAFRQYKLLPRVLVDVTNTSTTVKLLGKDLPVPIMIAPMAMQKMAHPDGELAVAQAAAKAGVPMIQSTMGTVGLKEVVDVGTKSGIPLMMFQLYVIKDRDFTKKLIQDAERAGYNALVVTVDAPQLGRREIDEKNSFKLPEGLQLDNLIPLYEKSGHGKRESQPGSAIAGVFASYIDSSLTWDFVAWCKAATKLPIFVKGILSPHDATAALQAKVDGIIVSNHGGRQVDFAPGSLEVLPAISQVVRGRVPVWIDGGVRRGTDIIKALILGADGVLLGRPILYGLALGGEAGVKRVLDIVIREFKLSMQLLGCASIQDLSRDKLIAPGDLICRM